MVNPTRQGRGSHPAWLCPSQNSQREQLCSVFIAPSAAPRVQLEIEDTLAAGRIDQEWGEKRPGNYLALLMLFINLLYLFFSSRAFRRQEILNTGRVGILPSHFCY